MSRHGPLKYNLAAEVGKTARVGDSYPRAVHQILNISVHIEVLKAGAKTYQRGPASSSESTKSISLLSYAWRHSLLRDITFLSLL